MTQAPRVTIWHNPSCGTSRNTLAMIRAQGIEPQIVLYLKTPPSRGELEQAIAAAGISAREAVRRKGALYSELGLDDATDEKLIATMAAHPALIERPFVFAPAGVRLCRPAERVREILP